ncbi:MAG: DNA polymerase III subunit gamma/tau [Ignavibacteriae bacterium]|nr:DNA polymerase III subunit gamma/tau [Ignavibacteriota bacterium]
MMTFIVTARKWRPQLFEDVVGQQHITTTLKNAIENNRIGHAYIFAGPRGVGKTTTARILAKRLNCKNPNGGEPCNKCDACENFLKSQSLDIIEIDGASNRRIDEIRTLRESVKYAPTSGEYKIYIIDEVHMLTTESFNALLKTLEEPPEHTIFIFATTDIHKVPLTIISRCQRFDFRRIELSEIKKLLNKIADSERIEIDDESLTLIAKKADGALRDAESVFDQVVSFCGNTVDSSILKKMLNLIDDEVYFQISDAILEKSFKTAFEVSENIYTNGWNFIDFINGLLEHFRNISTVIITKSANFIESSENLKSKYLKYSDKFSEGDLLRILSFLSKTQNEIKISQNQKLKVEISLSHLIGFVKSATLSELIAKVDIAEEITDKKKTELIEKINVGLKSEENIVINSVPEEAFPILKEEKKSVKIKPSPIAKSKTLDEVKFKNSPTIEIIKEKWNLIKEAIIKEKFTLSIFEHTFPDKLEKNILHILVDNKEDIPILNSSSEYISKRLSTLFDSNIIAKFEFRKTQKNSSSGKSVNEFKEDEIFKYPIIKSIVEELGGREIK